MVKKQIIGIIGGMGPYASAYFYKLLIEKSSGMYGAKNNDDFPEILVDSVPVPDFISNTKNLEKAKKMLILRVCKMNNFGVNTAAMICNTGHVLYPKLKEEFKGELFSLIEVTREKILMLGSKRIGILASPTTIKLNLYGESFSKLGLKVYYPNKIELELIEKIIRELISGKKNTTQTKMLQKMGGDLIKRHDLDSLVLGCTELPLVFPKGKFREFIVDPLEVLAEYLLNKYYEVQ